MRLSATFAILATISIAMTGCAQEDKPRFRIKAEPIFQVGDVARVKLTARGSMKKFDSAKRPVMDNHTHDTGVFTQEVIEINGSKRATALRFSILDLQRRVFSNIPQDTAFSTDVTLADICGQATINGGIFAGDVHTLLATQTKDLTASQVNLLKQTFSDRITFYAYPAYESLLLADGEISVGDKWSIHKDTLAQWAANSSLARGMSAPLNAEFELTDVSDTIATIKGKVTFAPMMEGSTGPTRISITHMVSTLTGQWLGMSATRTMNVSSTAVHMILRSEINVSVEFTPGPGRPRELAAIGWRKIGWNPDSQDSNSYNNRQAGISLNIPATFVKSAAEIKGSTIVEFLDGVKAAVHVKSVPMPRPATRGELMKFVIATDKALHGTYDVTDKQNLTLAGNVPAVMITANLPSSNPKVTLITLVASDRGRLVNVSIAVPIGERSRIQQAQAIAESLRVYNPAATPSAAQ